MLNIRQTALPDTRGNAIFQNFRDWMPVGNDLCQGDVILFIERVYYTPKRRPADMRYSKLKMRRIIAEIIGDYYDPKNMHHHFQLKVLRSSGFRAPKRGEILVRRGQNIYRHHTLRLPWKDEAAREAALEEKHQRRKEAEKLHEQTQQESASTWGYPLFKELEG